MPRNACQACRLSKLRCVFVDLGKQCVRCKTRDLKCSLKNYTADPNPGDSSPSGRPDEVEEVCVTTAIPNFRKRPLRPSSITPEPASLGSMPRLDQWRPPSITTSAQANSIFSIPDYPAKTLNANYIIGAGTPDEIVREVELTKDIVRLYFEHFADINFLFDSRSFLRDLELGEVSQMVLYSMMALGIRYSNAPCFEGSLPAHRGEPFIKQGHKFIKDDFDNISLHVLQTYVLQCTYWLSFGAGRKAWLYLGIASTMAKALRLSEDAFFDDPHRSDSCRRTLCNIAFLDRMLSPSFNMQCHFSLDEHFVEPLPSSTPPYVGLSASSTSLTVEIYRLSHLLCGVSIYHRRGNQDQSFIDYERQHLHWRHIMEQKLPYTRQSFHENHRRGTLRQFLFLHLLYHHIGQVLYFPSLREGHGPQLSAERGEAPAEVCQHHARRTIEIIDDAWGLAAMNMHSPFCGQILTVSAAVHMHSCLTTTSSAQKIASRARIDSIIGSFTRIRNQCRIFDGMLAQLNAFFHLCAQSSTAGTVFDYDTRLLRHMMHLGTAFERRNQKTGKIGILHDDWFTALQTDPDTGTPPRREEDACSPSITWQSSELQPTPQQQEKSQSLDWLSDAFDSMEDYSQMIDWVFSEASLQDLNSMAFMVEPGALPSNYWH